MIRLSWGVQRVRAACNGQQGCGGAIVLPLDITAPAAELHGAAVAADNAFEGAGVDYLVHNAGQYISLCSRHEDVCILIHQLGTRSLLRLQREDALVALPAPQPRSHCGQAGPSTAAVDCVSRPRVMNDGLPSLMVASPLQVPASMQLWRRFPPRWQMRCSSSMCWGQLP